MAGLGWADGLVELISGDVHHVFFGASSLGVPGGRGLYVVCRQYGPMYSISLPHATQMAFWPSFGSFFFWVIGPCPPRNAMISDARPGLCAGPPATVSGS